MDSKDAFIKHVVEHVKRTSFEVPLIWVSSEPEDLSDYQVLEVGNLFVAWHVLEFAND